jgi:hypothetical protein
MTELLKPWYTLSLPPIAKVFVPSIISSKKSTRNIQYLRSSNTLLPEFLKYLVFNLNFVPLETHVFDRGPNVNGPIHDDLQPSDNATECKWALNWIDSPDNGLKWYYPCDKKIYSKNLKEHYHAYYNRKDLELFSTYENTLPVLIRTDIPHEAYNNNSCIRRSYSIRGKLTSSTSDDWDHIVMNFKKIINE